MLDISVAPCYYIEALERAYAPVAQLDRVTDYESVGQGFESLLAYQNGYLRVSVLFIFQDSNFSMQQSVGVLPDCRKTAVAVRIVGASIARPPKNVVFRFFVGISSHFPPCGVRFCLRKIRGRPMVAPTNEMMVTGKHLLRQVLFYSLGCPREKNTCSSGKTVL